MGYFLLFESMLDTVLWARDNYLADGGVVLPNTCQICLAAAADPELRKKNLDFWDDVYGFKMTCMKTDVLKEGSLAIVKPETIITDSCVIKVYSHYTRKSFERPPIRSNRFVSWG